MKNNQTIGPLKPLNNDGKLYTSRGGFSYCFVSDKVGDLIFKVVSKGDFELTDNVIKEINTKAKYFKRFIPPTLVLQLNNGRILVQKKINGKLLKDSKLSDLEDKSIYEIILFLYDIIKYTITINNKIDLVGFQHETDNIKNEQNLPWLKDKLKKLLGTPHNRFKNTEVMNSTNIIIEEESGSIKFVDLTEDFGNPSKIGKMYLDICFPIFIVGILFQIGRLKYELYRRKIAKKVS